MAGVPGCETTSCKDGNICGVFKDSSVETLEENNCGVFNVSSFLFSSFLVLSFCIVWTCPVDAGTPDEQDAVLSLFNANAASNGFAEAAVEDDDFAVLLSDVMLSSSNGGIDELFLVVSICSMPIK